MSPTGPITGPTDGPERWVSRTQLADLMGVSIATIDRLTTDGMPSVTWGRRTRRYQPSVAIAWAAARQRDKEERS